MYLPKLINRLRLQAEDLHVLNPTSETVKCLSLGADALETQEGWIKELQAERNAYRDQIIRLKLAKHELAAALVVRDDALSKVPKIVNDDGSFDESNAIVDAALGIQPYAALSSLDQEIDKAMEAGK